MFHHSHSFPLIQPWQPKQINKEAESIAPKCFKASAKFKRDVIWNKKPINANERESK